MEGRIGARLLGAAVLCALLAAAASAQAPNCIPSCAADDGRFLAITDGAGLDTLTDQTLELQVRSPGGAFEIAFFDGETRGANHVPVGLWDINTGVDPEDPDIPPYAAQQMFDLFADPLGDGSGTTLVRSFDGEQMLDNDWTSFTVVDDPAAWNGEEYVYLLRAALGGELGPAVRSSFKVRTQADVFIEVFGQPFAFAASMPGLAEIDVIYPQNTCDFASTPPGPFPGCLGESGYDGDFAFYLRMEEPQQELLIWDGDADRGDYLGTNNDTDDPNTANDHTGLPPWACEDPTEPCTPDGGANPRLPTVEFEGVAMAPGPSTGNPPDDFDPFGGTGPDSLFLRTPAVFYEIWNPDGRLVATNDNPSGNREWELFRLATVDDGQADAVVSELPAGIYEVRVRGLDLENLNAFRFNVTVASEPTCDDGRPTSLTFTYTGHSCDAPEASNNLQGGLPGTTGDYRCSGPLDGHEPVKLVTIKKPERFEVSPDLVDLNESVTIRALTSNDKLFPHAELQLQAADGTVLQDITLHTSCSQPLSVEDQFGSLRVNNFSIRF